jgi:regulator of protease activity HflC (stomatin/prohibitin superfamily)
MIAFPWSRRNNSSDDPPKRSALWSFIRPRLASTVLYLLIAIFAVTVLWPFMVVTVPSGQVGVVWKRFGGGTVLDASRLRDEGLQVILPWDRLFLYNLRIQSVTETYHAISSDGIGLIATVNIRFRLRREFIPPLHQSIGPNYLSLMGPEVASRMREVISQYTAEQAYSTERQKIQDEIKNRVIEKLGERFLERDGEASYRVMIRDVGVLYDTLLHEIKLPVEVIAAINRKAEQYYISQEYVYRVDRERRESERKRIEAEGVSAFQQIVSQGISDSYLRWRGIEATLELARSNNAKIVIIGGGKDGLPIILGNVDSSALPRAGSAQTDPASATPPPSSLAATSSGEAIPNPGAGSAQSSVPPAASPQERQSLLPFGSSYVENFLSRLREMPRIGGSAPGESAGR